MIRRLSDDARRLVLGAAAVEAHRRGDRRLGTDHLLLGLLHDPSGETARLLGVDLASARAADEALDRAALAAVGLGTVDVPLIPATAAAGRPPLSSGARAVLQRALNQARVEETRRIQTRHFLLALLERRHPDPAAALLGALEVDPSAMRARLAGSPTETSKEKA